LNQDESAVVSALSSAEILPYFRTLPGYRSSVLTVARTDARGGQETWK
jgi:hypothetical protein